MKRDPNETAINNSYGDTGGQTTRGNTDPNSSKSRRSNTDERRHKIK